MTWLPTWQHFLLGEFSGGQVFWATSNPQTRNLASKELKFETFFLLFFSSCPSYQPLPQITLPWAEIHDWLVHCFTIV